MPHASSRLISFRIIGFLIVAVLMTISSHRSHEDFIFPVWQTRTQNMPYVAWLCIVTLCTILSWLVYIRQYWIHMSVTGLKETGKNIRESSLSLCMCFPVQVTIVSCVMWAPETQAYAEIIATLLDCIMLYLLLEVLLGYVGSWERAHIPLQTLEREPIFAVLLLTPWKTCQPSITFTSLLLQHFRKGLWVTLNFSVASAIITLILGISGNGNFIEYTLLVVKVSMFFSFQVVMTVVHPLRHLIDRIFPISKLVCVKLGVAIGIFQMIILRQFATPIGDQGIFQASVFVFLLNKLITCVEFTLITVFLVPAYYCSTDYSFEVNVEVDVEDEGRGNVENEGEGIILTQRSPQAVTAVPS